MYLAKKKLELESCSAFTVKDQPHRLWALESFAGHKIIVTHHPLLEPTKKLTMRFTPEEALDQLKPTKAKLPQLLDKAYLQ